MYDIKTIELDKVVDIVSRKCKTEFAKSLLTNIEFPSSYEECIINQGETKNAFDLTVKLGELEIFDLDICYTALKRAKAYAILNELELLSIVNLLDNVAGVLKYQANANGIKQDITYLLKYFTSLENIPALKTNITLAISKDGYVLDNASKELFMIRRSISSMENRLRSKLNELLTTRQSMLTEPLIVQRDGRMCLPVKIEYKNTFKGIVHDVSSSQTTAYIEPQETVETYNQIMAYKEKEKREVQIILKNLSLMVSANIDVLKLNLDTIIKLDSIFAKAIYAKEMDYYPANINNQCAFTIKKAKHPLIDRSKCIPIDVELGNKHNVIIITGPNTGGKTVLLKTVGLLHSLAYLGYMLPCDRDSQFGYFKSIQADIGDEQSIEQSLSTFSSHMTKIIKILSTATNDSLLLLDELGSGTDPKEGSSLAISIIDYLKSNGVRVICTTHYSELKNYAYNTNGIINASVEFNTETLLPTYRLLMGVPGKSNAIEIASQLGLNPSIIDASRQYLNSNSTESQNLISNLEEEMTSLRNKEEELDHKIKEYEGLVLSLNREKLDLVKRTDKIIENSKKEASKILADAKEEALKLIDEIKNMSSDNFKEHELADLKHKTNSLKVSNSEEKVFKDELHVGDFVYIKSYQKYGTIAKLKKDKYVVNIGQFAMEFDYNDLQLSAKPVEKPQPKKRLTGYNPTSRVQISLDLRGKRYDEVKPLMDSFIDDAILGNLEYVRIIHGFGTGAIRQAVQEYLKKCKFAKSYRYGGEGEGLNGVTVVYLK